MLQDIAAQGQGLPHALRSRPRLRADNRFYWAAFIALSHARGYAPGALQPITVGEVLAYAAMSGWGGGEMGMTLLRHVQAMDRAYLAFHREQRI